MKKISIIMLFLCLGSAFANPNKAMLYSVLVPGGGQVYNGAYLKAGLVLGVQSYLIVNTVIQDNKAQNNKRLMKDGDPALQSYYKAEYESYKERRNSNIWWIGVTTVLSMIDAYVDAHLVDFEDQKEGLRLRFEDDMLSLRYNF